VIVCGILAAGCAYFISSRTEPVYQAETRVLVNQATSGSAGIEYSDIMANERLARTYSELLKVSPVLETTIEELGLLMTANDLKDLVQVQMVRDTQLINLSVENTSPAQAAAIANKIPAVFAA
jgi:capsular polysaccharide biosynthesis protein